jgi:DNA-binding NtrC family response regulator
LKVVDLHLSPLNDRKSDIPELVGYFLRIFNGKQGANVTDVTPRAMEAMMAYHWPGNIRELNNAIERAMIFCDGESIDLPDLPSDVVKPLLDGG